MCCVHGPWCRSFLSKPVNCVDLKKDTDAVLEPDAMDPGLPGLQVFG